MGRVQGENLGSEMRTRIISVDAQMKTFDFLFGVSFGYRLMCHPDNLSKTLQLKSLLAAESQRLARLTQVLQSVCDAEQACMQVLQDQE